MKLKILILLAMLPMALLAQERNIFLDRTFWGEHPNVATIKEKIAEGNDPTAMTANGFDGLVYAIMQKAPMETIQYMLSLEGNDVNKATHDGRNYLMWASNSGNIPLMKWLLTQDSKTDIVDDHGYNLLTFAAAGGNLNTEVYDLILANGGKVDDATRAGANVLHLLAARLKDDEIIKYFQQKGLDIHSKDNAGNGMFNYAARMGNIENMKKLIDMGLEYDGINKEGGNAVIFAAQGSRGGTNPQSVFEYLEGLGIEIDVVTSDGRTPLHYAAQRAQDPAIIDYFIGKCVNVNQVDKEGNTAFLNAAAGGNLDVVKKLTPMVKDINYSNHDGHTALSLAVQRNAAPTFEYLLSKGAKVDVVDAEGNNLAYHIFNAYNSRQKDAFATFMKAAKEAGVNFTDKFADGSSLLHLAIEKGEKSLAMKALELGIDINQKNRDGLTPLHLAAMKAKDDTLLKWLLDKGADKKILTEFDESVYDLATENEKLSQGGKDLDFLRSK